MKRVFHLSLLAISLMLFACSGKEDGGEAKTAGSTHINDSLSKLLQRARADSMKRLNPLLILPPDSEYSGQYIDRYKNGIVKFRGTFRFGERHGQWLSFYPNGLLWSEMHYDNGLRHGPNNTFYENGKPRYSGFYKNDRVDSVWTYYDSTGKVQNILTYRNNVLVDKKELN